MVVVAWSRVLSVVVVVVVVDKSLHGLQEQSRLDWPAHDGVQGGRNGCGVLLKAAYTVRLHMLNRG